MRIGAVSGGIAAVPFVLFGLLVFGGVALGGASSALFFVFFLFVVVALGAGYTVGLSAIGGVIGWYVREETTLGDDIRDAI